MQKEPSKSWVNKAKTNPDFNEELKTLTYFGSTVITRAKNASSFITNYVNPLWTTDYGSGGNEEGHLRLMRQFIYEEYDVKATAKAKVDGAARTFRNRCKTQKLTVEQIKVKLQQQQGSK